MKKLILLAMAMVMALFVAGCASTEDLSNVEDTGAITPLDELDHDWGDISIEGGMVSHGFHFVNEGNERLILKGAVTSCMCTTAYFELEDGTMSPEYGMHQGADWQYEVAPGESFEVEVVFDPMAHGPDGVGSIKRSVTIFSSITGDDMVVTANANVMYEDDYQSKYGEGDFIFEETEYDFGLLKQSSGISQHEFSFTYVGTDPIEVTAVPTSCACTTAKISQNEFESGDEGILTVYFDANLHEEPEGVFFKTVSLLTDPELEKDAEVKIWAEIDLDLGPEAYKLTELHED
jgi:hypothetical protein